MECKDWNDKWIECIVREKKVSVTPMELVVISIGQMDMNFVDNENGWRNVALYSTNLPYDKLKVEKL